MVSRTFYLGNVEKFRYVKGHLVVELMTMNPRATAESKIGFIHDTGAFITVINRTHFNALNIEASGIKLMPCDIGSYGNKVPGHTWTLPFLFVGGFTASNVQCFTPLDYRRRQNLLGMNVLARFNQYIDTTNARVYFEKNLGDVSAYHMLCGEVFLTEK